MLLRITHYGEPILEKKGQPIERFDAALERLVEDMIETMYHHHGLGLAAQQVNRALQLCVVDVLPSFQEEAPLDYTYDGGKTSLQALMPLVIVNPKLTYLSEDQTIAMEGCLSFPNLQIPVKRYNSIELAFQDLRGDSHVLVCHDFFARVIQHEVDHVHSVLYIDRCVLQRNEETEELQEALRALKKQSHLRRLSRPKRKKRSQQSF